MFCEEFGIIQAFFILFQILFGRSFVVGPYLSLFSMYVFQSRLKYDAHLKTWRQKVFSLSPKKMDRCDYKVYQISSLPTCFLQKWNTAYLSQSIQVTFLPSGHSCPLARHWMTEKLKLNRPDFVLGSFNLASQTAARSKFKIAYMHLRMELQTSFPT